MAYTPLKIVIPDPCHEDWKEMHPVPGTTARHCDSCVKNVVDFTGFTDAQIHAYVRENKGKLCGRFRPDQLQRPLRAVSAPTKSPLKVAAAAAGLLLAATGCETQSSASDTVGPPIVETEVLFDGLTALTPPRTGDIALEEASSLPTPPAPAPEIAIPVAGGIKASLPPPPPPMEEVETIEGELNIEELSEALNLNDDSSQVLVTMEEEEVLMGDISLEDEIYIIFPEQDSLPPIPEPPMIMGFVITETPRPTGIDWVKDTVRSLLPSLPAPPTQHLRPRPDVPAHLQALTVYPNPFVDHLNIDLELPAPETLTVELISLAGRVVHTQVWEATAGQNTLKVEPRRRKLKHTGYLLRITDNQAFSVTRKLVR